MIEESAKVIALQNDLVWVETQRKTVCGQCAANKGCGTSVLANILGKKRNSVPVLTTLPVQVGDEVLIGIEENALVKGSLLLYALPLVFLIGFGLLGEIISIQVKLSNTDVLTVIFAVLGFSIGFIWLKHILSPNRLDQRYQPKILRIVNSISIS